jgi:hypothetical protein
VTFSLTTQASQVVSVLIPHGLVEVIDTP